MQSFTGYSLSTAKGYTPVQGQSFNIHQKILKRDILTVNTLEADDNVAKILRISLCMKK